MMVKAVKDLGIRTLINSFSVIGIALLIVLGERAPLRWIFALAVAAVAAVAVWEYCQIIKRKQLFPATYLSMIAVVFYVFSISFKTQSAYESQFLTLYAPSILLCLAFFACFLHFAIVNKPPITNIATTFLGIVYIGVPLGLFVNIMFFFTANSEGHFHMQGSWWIIYLIAVTKSADIGGYFVGGHFGKRKLALKLSPNKTLEGALGGLIASVGMSLLICFLGKKFGEVFNKVTYFESIIIGILIGILGQIGDLAESLLKRDAEIKDSNTIPGVGGILDMVDSLLFTAPLVYIYLKIIYT